LGSGRLRSHAGKSSGSLPGTGQEKEEDVMKKFKTIAIWTLSALLAFVFLAFGAGKFLSPTVAAQFARWGYPDWLRTAIGVLEIAGALILLVPRVAWEGAVILAPGRCDFHAPPLWRGLPRRAPSRASVRSRDHRLSAPSALLSYRPPHGGSGLGG